MKIGNYELRKPWVKYVNMPIEEEIYWAVRDSIKEDIALEIQDAIESNLPPIDEIDYAVHAALGWAVDTVRRSNGPRFDTFCVKCKGKKIMQDAIIYRTDSGRSMATGKCPDCGGKVNRIMEKDRG
jgi:hypothetical protein